MVRSVVVACLLIACGPKVVSGPTPTAAVQGPVVNKSPIDDRSYRVVELDNGLRAVVVHDPNADKAAAALSVNVGHLVDPERRQGLAHFLEHMLFMGTDEFPNVDDYRKFIQDNGGSSNAGTGTESTTYYFDVNHEHLEPALDRFSRFFVAPKLDAEFVERERNAVNAEYSLKIKEDVRRIREVQKKTRNPAHPYSKFSVGNLDFLGDRDGEDLHADLRELYAAHYVADNMTLSVLGRESLDALEALVRREFSSVPVRTVARPGPRPAPYLPEQLGVEIRIVPERDTKSLRLVFPVPPTREHPDERPLDVLLSVFNDEGEGSLYAELKKRGWAQSLRASEDGTDDFSLFVATIELTEEGYAHRDEVTALFFQQVELLRSADLRPVFDEMKTVGDLAFRFAEEVSPRGAVASIVRVMPYVEVEHVLDVYTRVARFDADLIRNDYLSAFRPDNLRLIVVAPDVATDQVEALYSTPYAIEPLSEARQQAFSAEVAHSMALRPPNPYLPEDTSLVAGTDAVVPTQVDTGIDGLTVWHLADPSFGVPRANVEVKLVHPAVNDLRSRMLGQLTARLLDDALESWRQPLTRAGVYVGVGSRSYGMHLRVSGYDDKQALVLEEFVGRLAAFEVDPKRLEIERADLLRDLRNERKKRPIRQLFAATRDLLDPDRADVDAQISALEAFTAADVTAFADTLKTGHTARMLAHGNLTEADVKGLAASLAPLVAPGHVHTDKLRRIDEGELVVDVPIDHADSTIAVVFHGEGADDALENAQFALLKSLVRTDFFTQLRSEQQLGYAVYATSLNNREQPALAFAIQSAVANPELLEERIDAFLLERPAAIEALTPEAFSAVKDGLVADLLEAETRLSNRTERLEDALDEHHLDFDWREQRAAAVGSMSQADMVAFARSLLLDRPRRMVTRSTGTAHDPVTPAACQYPRCDGLDSFAVSEQVR